MLLKELLYRKIESSVDMIIPGQKHRTEEARMKQDFYSSPVFFLLFKIL